MRFIMLDTETTGLSAKDGDRIIELGCVEIIDRVMTGNDLHLYFNPEREVGTESFAIHGLSDEFLSAKPLFNTLTQKILDYLQDATLVIHNSAFDLSFLNMEYERAGFTKNCFSDKFNIIDTLSMARKMHPGARCSLDALCKRYNVDASKRTVHGALLDSQLLAQVYLGLTGGQVQMFAEKSDVSEQEVDYEWLDKTTDMPIVQVSEAEALAHREYLQGMPSSMWQD
jgi:DNA polymerase-3 subunit epsilon